MAAISYPDPRDPKFVAKIKLPKPGGSGGPTGKERQFVEPPKVIEVERKKQSEDGLGTIIGTVAGLALLGAFDG